MVTAILFLIGCGFAWFTWTQIARVKVFHQPPYSPPVVALAGACVAIVALIAVAFRLGPGRSPSRSFAPPRPSLLFIASLVWAIVLYALVVIAFGIAPDLSPIYPLTVSAALVLVALAVPHWSGHPNWKGIHAWSVAAGAVTGTMLASFVGFIQSIDVDFWFKIAMNLAALIGLIALGLRVSAYRSGALNDGNSL